MAGGERGEPAEGGEGGPGPQAAPRPDCPPLQGEGGPRSGDLQSVLQGHHQPLLRLGGRQGVPGIDCHRETDRMLVNCHHSSL